MGLVYVEGVVKHGGVSVKTRFLVGSGATYTVLTKSVWEISPLCDCTSIFSD